MSALVVPVAQVAQLALAQADRQERPGVTPISQARLSKLAVAQAEALAAARATLAATAGRKAGCLDSVLPTQTLSVARESLVHLALLGETPNMVGRMVAAAQQRELRTAEARCGLGPEAETAVA